MNPTFASNMSNKLGGMATEPLPVTGTLMGNQQPQQQTVPFSQQANYPPFMINSNQPQQMSGMYLLLYLYTYLFVKKYYFNLRVPKFRIF